MKALQNVRKQQNLLLEDIVKINYVEESLSAEFWRTFRELSQSVDGNGQQTHIVLGFVSRTIGDNGFGQVTIDGFPCKGEARFLALPAEWGPFVIEAGKDAPVFGDAVIASNRNPGNTDALVLELWHRDCGLCVKAWAYLEDWAKAEAAVEAANEAAKHTVILKFQKRLEKTENTQTHPANGNRPKAAQQHKPERKKSFEFKDLSALEGLVLK